MHRFLLQIVLFFFAQTAFCSAGDDNLVVDTQAGSIRGRLQNIIHGLSVKQFLGIPYAEPPVGELRFARPQPAEPWKGVREAVEFGPTCPQISMKEFIDPSKFNSTVTIKDEPQSEDCLTLNVYTPSQASVNDKKSVMVWIHGGGFISGSGSSYNPSVLVSHHDIIAVTINYRLGVFGFFNIPGTDIKGNYGMHDQVLALKWVQQNIANFGGDPNKVTIFGESAGAMSVANHLLSPLSKGLFQRAITQSGSASYFGNGNHVKSTENVKTFAKVLNCDTENNLISCLRRKSWTDLFAAQRNVTFPANMGDQTLTIVIVDGEFLPDIPRNLLSKPNGTGINSEVEVMMGVTANEGGFWALMALDMYKDGVDASFFEQSIRNGMKLHSPHNKLIEDATLFEYLDHSDLGNRIKNRQALMDMYSDNIFNAPAVFEAKALSNANIPVYFYVFDHIPHFSQLPKWLGAAHGLDLYFSFGVAVQSDGFLELFKILVSKFTKMEVGLSRYVMKMWTDFAKYGDPNADETTPVVTWPRYNSSEHVHLRISLEPKVEHSFRERKVAFWNEFVPKLAAKQQERESVTEKESAVKEEL